MSASPSIAGEPGQSWPDIAGQTLWPMGPGVSIEIVEAGQTPALPAAAGELWKRRCAANPRLHDGAILAVTSLDASKGRIACAHDRFQRLASQGEGAELGVRLLGIKGMVVARSRDGMEHVLIARRGRETRVYGDMWELAPAGGVDVPDAGVNRLDERDLVRTVVHEGAEELGLVLDESEVRVVAIVRDEIACSFDLVARVDWPEIIDPERALCHREDCSWEYTDSAWLSRADAAGFERRSAAVMVGPMRAAQRWMGWT